MYFYSNSRTNLSTLFEVVGDCYDSLPAVNSDTSLPILFKGVCSFPNYRHSFYPYSPKVHSHNNCTDPFYKELENNPYPYGYEFEECFLKHDYQRPYRPGKFIKDFVRNTNKFIDTYFHNIHIQYMPKSNTYIVKSSFDRSKRHVFFKQTNKLITTIDEQPKWNSHLSLSLNFREEILKHLEVTDSKLYTALSSVPSYSKDFRTILNNPFWKETQATFLLNRDKDFKKLKRSCQYYHKKSKNYFEVNKTFDGLPKEFVQAILTTPDIRLTDIPVLKDIYDFVYSVNPDLANSSFINLNDFYFRWTARNYSKIQTELNDPIFKKFLTEVKDHFKTFIKTVETFAKLKADLSLTLSFTGSLNNPNKPYLEFMRDLDLHIRLDNFNNTLGKNVRETVSLKDNSELVINPSLSEILDCIGTDINLATNSSSPSVNLYLHKDILYSNYKDFLCNSGLGFVMDNADVLSAKMPSFKEILKGNLNFGPEKPINIVEDDFAF